MKKIILEIKTLSILVTKQLQIKNYLQEVIWQNLKYKIISLILKKMINIFKMCKIT